MKVKFKGTKGKWELSDDKRNICVLIKPQTYKTICSNFYNTKWQYDAKLISNAPILLEALQDLVRYCEENKVGAELEFAKDVLMKSGS